MRVSERSWKYCAVYPTSPAVRRDRTVATARAAHPHNALQCAVKYLVRAYSQDGKVNHEHEIRQGPAAWLRSCRLQNAAVLTEITRVRQDGLPTPTSSAVKMHAKVSAVHCRSDKATLAMLALQGLQHVSNISPSLTRLQSQV